MQSLDHAPLLACLISPLIPSDGLAAGRPISPTESRQVVDDTEDFTQLDDPEFLAERRRVNAMVERTPPDEQSPELIERYRGLNDEFMWLAWAAWALASKGL